MMMSLPMLFAATGQVKDKACLGGGSSCDTGLPKIAANQSSFNTLLAIFFSTLGAMAVLFVIIGAFKYVQSQGDPQETTKARNTIIYALVGLVVAVLSAAIVGLVLGGL